MSLALSEGNSCAPSILLSMLATGRNRWQLRNGFHPSSKEQELGYISTSVPSNIVETDILLQG
jgi:hypothetical protein